MALFLHLAARLLGDAHLGARAAELLVHARTPSGRELGPGIVTGAAGIEFVRELFGGTTATAPGLPALVPREAGVAVEPWDFFDGTHAARCLLLSGRRAGAAETMSLQQSTRDVFERLTERFRSGEPPALGIAHGAAGFLAAMSFAGRDPVVGGLRRDVVRLLTARVGAPEVRRADGHPTAWCIGTIGVLSALAESEQFLDPGDGSAVHRQVRRALLELLEPSPAAPGGAIGLCHGYAGVATTLQQLARRHRSEIVIERARESARSLLNALPETTAVRDAALASAPIWRGDLVGMLEGLSGAGLALIAALQSDYDAWYPLMGALPAEGSA